MINTIVTAVLASTLENIAWPMCRAGAQACSLSGTVRRFWKAVGCTGEALEAWLERAAAAQGIDIAQHMIARAYAI